MLLPPLVSPPLEAQMPTPYEDRQAEAQLKLHLLMAQLRTTLRAVMSGTRPWKIANWKKNVGDELVHVPAMQHIVINIVGQDQVLVQIGFCAVNSFRITIPYIVRDMCDMLHNVFPPAIPENNMLLGSINMDYTAEENAEILAETEHHGYWWTYQEGNENAPQPCKEIIDNHFQDYFCTVSGVGWTIHFA